MVLATTKHKVGRKKRTDRCACGEMTKDRAQKRFHVCERDLTEDELERQATVRYGLEFIAKVSAAAPAWVRWTWLERIEVLEAEAGRGGAW